MYAVYHGPQGLKNIAKRVNLAAQIAVNLFEHYGFNVATSRKEYANFFDTITITDCDAVKLTEVFEKKGVNINLIN